MASSWALPRFFSRTRVTRLPTVPRHMFDLARTVLLASALVTCAPMAPFGPLTRFGFWAGRRRLALCKLGERPLARRASILGRLQDLPRMQALARATACHGASTT